MKRRAVITHHNLLSEPGSGACEPGLPVIQPITFTCGHGPAERPVEDRAESPDTAGKHGGRAIRAGSRPMVQKAYIRSQPCILRQYRKRYCEHCHRDESRQNVELRPCDYIRKHGEEVRAGQFSTFFHRPATTLDDPRRPATLARIRAPSHPARHRPRLRTTGRGSFARWRRGAG